MSKDNYFYITTPIYYVNDKPHIGHAYTTILADVLSRYHRLRGDKTFFLTGVDEHGQKVQQSAEKEGIDPQRYCDSMVVHFQTAWRRLEIKYDFFIRTTYDFHKKVVQASLQELHDKNEIYEDEYGGFYCVGCERFYTKKELIDGKCPQHLKKPEYIKEKNYFFKMSKYQDWLIEYITTHPEFIRPRSRKNEVLGFLKNPLGDLCISRPKSRLQWGIELPFDKDYVTYVWFDALLNYVTAVGYKQDEERFNEWWPAHCHLIGKDIVITHCVYWPIMLEALGISMPKTIFAHGWWLIEEMKMSKSLKNIIQPLDLIDPYGADSVRYFLIREMVLGQDANFSEEIFINRYNSELANDFGNLASRVLVLIRKNFDSIVPELRKFTKDDKEMQKRAEALPDIVFKLIDEFKVSESLDAIIEFVRSLNRYLEVRQPWHLVKRNQDEAASVLYIATEGLRMAAQLLHPVMPEQISTLLQALPVSTQILKWGALKTGGSIGEIPTLFPRITKEKTTRVKIMDKKKDFMSVEDLSKVKLLTAEVKSAEKVEGTDKLLKLSVDIGGEIRQIVAGIAQHYKPEDLVGKMVIIVENLQPAKIRGIESQGMLLAAEKGGNLSLLTTMDSIEKGAIIR
jgi:methionyl-tRNA synthetase